MLSIFSPLTKASLGSTRALFSTSTAVWKRASVSKKYADVKGPTTAYAAFNSHIYKTNKDELMKLPFRERSLKIASEWRLLSAEQLKPFYDTAAKDRQRYESEKAAIDANAPPKVPANGYARFYSDIRPQLIAENPKATFGEIGRFAGEKWRALPQAEKDQYKKEFLAELAIYKQAVDNHKAKSA